LELEKERKMLVDPDTTNKFTGKDWIYVQGHQGDRKIPINKRYLVRVSGDFFAKFNYDNTNYENGVKVNLIQKTIISLPTVFQVPHHNKKSPGKNDIKRVRKLLL
jgi:hypothetical protein